jgi:hypothetical protein
MDSGLAIFEPVDMEQPCLQIDGILAQRHGFGHPQPMSIHEENERRITAGMAADFSGGHDDLIDFM